MHYGIIGGGFLGMTLALKLAQAGERVSLYEAGDHFGGLADAWRLGDIEWDRHYHVILLSDGHTRALLREIGLEQKMQWRETRTGFFSGGHLYSMSNSMEFLRFPPLNLIDKFRLAMTILIASRMKDGDKLEQVLVEDWLQRLSGKQVFKKMWLPLLKSKLGENYRITSAAFICATIARMYAARDSGLKKEMFGYMRGGYATIIAALESRLRQLGVEIHLSTPVQAVRAGPIIQTEAGEIKLDRIIVTAPAPVIPRLCPGLGEAECERLGKIEYQGILCASLLLKRPLADFYVTNITDDGLPFTGIIEMSALVDTTEFGSRHLVYLPRYLPSASPEFENSDDSLKERFLLGLERMYPEFRRDDVEAFRISRVRHVMAIPTLNYSQLAPPVRTSLDRVFIATSAQIRNGTLNINETLNMAQTALQEIREAA